MDVASSVENNGVSDLILKLCNHMAKNDEGMKLLKQFLQILKFHYISSINDEN